MKARSLAALVALGLLTACGRGTTRVETRTFALRYLDASEVRRLLDPYVDTERPAAKGQLSVGSGTVTVRETPDNLERIGRVLAEYDRPQPSVRLTFKVIRADGATRADPSIADVEAALHSLFRFAGYALVAEGVMTGSPASQSEQTLSGDGGPYSLRATIFTVNGRGDSATVQIRVQLTAPRGGAFETTVGVPVGRTAVLGNVTGSSPNSAMILTVRPDLVAN